MGKVSRDFISEENREYKFKIGKLVASSLAGFVFGVLGASIVWIIIIQNFGLAVK
ncbi:MAG: hypothetical protein PHV43_02045 [Candidatus Colwellbacteria bacterium]|nr:hypothetical protein [Candidatus Colwellbacteria bacterium]